MLSTKADLWILSNSCWLIKNAWLFVPVGFGRTWLFGDEGILNAYLLDFISKIQVVKFVGTCSVFHRVMVSNRNRGLFAQAGPDLHGRGSQCLFGWPTNQSISFWQEKKSFSDSWRLQCSRVIRKCLNLALQLRIGQLQDGQRLYPTIQTLKHKKLNILGC